MIGGDRTIVLVVGGVMVLGLGGVWGVVLVLVFLCWLMVELRLG